MSDDDRIERLTQLARRMWPDRPYVEVRSGIGFAEVRDGPRDGGWIDSLLRVDHGNALDALEAALLVLDGARVVPDGALRDAYCRGVVDALEESPAWVEQLAAQWEREALEPPPETVRTAHPPYLLRVALQECAKELRARAKGSP